MANRKLWKTGDTFIIVELLIQYPDIGVRNVCSPYPVIVWAD